MPDLDRGDIPHWYDPSAYDRGLDDVVSARQITATCHMRPRRFRLHWGQNDGAGYVVTDSTKVGRDWRGAVVWHGDSRSDGEAVAERLNKEAT